MPLEVSVGERVAGIDPTIFKACTNKERGLIVVDSFAQHHITFSHPNRRPLWDYWGSDNNQGLIDEFVASIRESRQPAITGRDGLKAVEAVLAAYQSAETHDVVKLT